MFTRAILVAIAAAASVVLIVGLGISVPIQRHAMTATLGPWSAPTEVISDRVLLMDSCDETLYAKGWTYLVASPNEGGIWSSGITVLGTLDADNYVLYRVNYSDAFPSRDMFFSRSLDNGATWIDYRYVMTPDGGSDGAYRIFKMGSIMIFYTYVNAGGEGFINYSMSIDEGNSWRPQAYIDDYVHVEDPIAADIVYCQGKLFLAYYHYGTDPIEFHHVVVIESDDMGATWTNRQVVGDGWLPVIKADSGNLYVTYWNYTTYDRLMFTTSSDAGATWSTPMENGALESATDASNYHSLAVSGSQVFASYMECTPTYDEYTLHMNYSDDGGSTWNDMGEVIGMDTNACYPSLLISNGKLHFMFVDVGDPIGYPGTTYHRWLWLEEPIPEFSTLLVPILLTIALMILVSRRR